ncbi:MAG: YggT family protein [Pseudomonadota bacterium]
MFLSVLLDAYSLVVLAAVVVSWLPVSPHHPVVRFLAALTEPLLTPIRRILPPFGGFDLSPMVLLLGLRALRSLL